MKNFFILLFAILLGSQFASGQNVSFTVKAGSTPSSAKVFVTSNGDITGVVSQILITFTIPSSIAGVPPATTYTGNVVYPQWGALSLSTPTTESVDGTNSYVYTYFGAPVTSTTTTFTNGVEVLLGEVSFPDGTDLTNLRLASVPDGGLSSISYLVLEVGGVVISNTTSLTYGTGAVNSASGFSGYSYVPFPGPITPVSFLSFYALKNGDDAKLNWTVEHDIDNKHFEIERSLNGRNFISVAKINALSNGKSLNTYESSDLRLSSLGSKLIYYRIKQVDKNNTISYSAVRNLNLSFKGSGLSLFPNPARTTTKMVIDAEMAGKATISIRDAGGRQVQMISTELVKGINQKDLNVSALPSGEYNVTVLGENINQTIKLSKIN